MEEQWRSNRGAIEERSRGDLLSVDNHCVARGAGRFGREKSALAHVTHAAAGRARPLSSCHSRARSLCQVDCSEGAHVTDLQELCDGLMLLTCMTCAKWTAVSTADIEARSEGAHGRSTCTASVTRTAVEELMSRPLCDVDCSELTVSIVARSADSPAGRYRPAGWVSSRGEY
jgi:hypothetical protein